MDEIDDEILSVLRSMEGVHHADKVSGDMKKRLIKEEKRYASLGPIAVENVGVMTAVSRERVYFIIKDSRFRSPPMPTVQLLAEDGTVLGEEIINGKMSEQYEGERLLYIGKGFVIYSSRAKGSGKNSKFVLPPVPFPELEDFGLAKNVVSASPSTLGDVELRKSACLEDDPKLASILIGLDIG